MMLCFRLPERVRPLSDRRVLSNREHSDKELHAIHEKNFLQWSFTSVIADQQLKR